MPESNELPEFLVSTEQLRNFVAECELSKRRGEHPELVAEGERLAKNFRMLFPDVSDRDLGTLIITFCQVFTALAECDLMNISILLHKVITSYGYAASDIVAGALAVEDITSGK